MNQINESEVKNKMAGMNKEKLQDMMKERNNANGKVTGGTAPVDETKVEETTPVTEPAEETAPATEPVAKVEETVPTEGVVKTTSEFNGKKEKDGEGTEEDAESKFVTAATPGISNFIEKPATMSNSMPNEEGQVASEPFITYDKTSEKTKKVTSFGRFHKNVKGVDKLVEYSLKTAIDPSAKGKALKDIKEAQDDLNEAVSSGKQVNTTKLREYITKHGYFVCETVAHDNKPMIKINRRDIKNEAGTVTETQTGFKVAESGTGGISVFMVYVPERAWSLFDENTNEDTELVAEVIAEENPKMILVTIKRDMFIMELGYRTARGLRVMPEFIHKDSCRTIVSDNPLVGNPEVVHIDIKTINMQQGNDPKVIEAQKKLEEKKQRYTEKFGSVEKAMFPTMFRLVDSARASLISPLNYIPQRTQKMISVGSKFVPKEGESAKDMTELYFNASFRAKKAQGAPMDSYVGKVLSPTLPGAKPAHKFCFNVSVTPDGIDNNPLFYNAGEKVMVEPYFKTLTKTEDGKYTSTKVFSSYATQVVKKVKDTKSGNIKVESNLIGSEEYDKTYYNNVRRIFESAVKEENVFPSLEALTKLCTTRASSGKGRGTSTATSENKNQPLMADIARVLVNDPEVFSHYLESKSKLSNLTTKVQMYSNKYKEELDKASGKSSRAALRTEI